MNTVDKNLSARRIAAIRSDLHAIPDAPVGPHLTLELYLGYAKASLAEPTIEELDRHVASCLDCATNLERWVTAVDLFGKLVQNVRAKLEFSSRPAPQWAFGFCSKREVQIASPDRMVGLYMVENEGGDLELRLGSRYAEHAGRTLRLRVGEWHRDIRLQPVDDKEVGGKLIITREEREKFPEGAVPETELLP